MSGSLAEALKEHDASPASLAYAVRLLVAKESDHVPPTQMRAELEAAIGAEALDRALAELESDAALLEAADLEILEAAWSDDESRAQVEAALLGAHEKLPVIELGILALVAMYGMWLHKTDGVKRRTRTRRSPDGWEETETVENYDPAESLGKLVDLVNPARDGGEKPAGD